jgi:hypothetical protein
MRKLTLPDELQATMHHNYDLFEDTNVGNKLVGACSLVEGATWAQLKGKGLSHVYRNGGFPKDDLSWTLLATELLPMSGIHEGRPYPTQAEAEAAAVRLANTYTKKSIITDEFTDGDQAISSHFHWQTASHFYKKLVQVLGSSSPADNNIFGSYMGTSITPGKFNIYTGGKAVEPLHPYYVEGLKSSANARKTLNTADGTWLIDHPFFQMGLHEVINWQTGAYFGLNEIEESHFFYSLLDEVMRKYVADVDKTILYFSPWSQSVLLPTDVQWKNSGWVINYDNGYFESEDWHVCPNHAMMFFGFFGLLLTNGLMSFDSVRYEVSKDVKKLSQNPHINRLEWHGFRSQPARL